MLVNSQPDMEVVAQAGDGEAAVQRAREIRPDVVVVDVAMPTMSGLEVTVALKHALPATRIVALTRHGEYQYVQELLRAGANGYVLKQSSSRDLLQAIRVVAGGKSFLDPLVTSQLTRHYSAEARRRSAAAGGRRVEPARTGSAPAAGAWLRQPRDRHRTRHQREDR